MFGTNSLNFLTKNKAQLKNSLSTSSPHSICLLSSTQFNPYKFMERNFTITTNNSSGKFNKYLLSKTSSEILSFIKENPNDLQFHINIQDENKVIEKFEKLYQGETVEFNKNDISISSKIIDHLHLSINFVKHNFSSSTIINLTQKNKIYTINIVQNLNEYIENSKSKFSFALFATENNNNIFNFINAIPEFTIQTKKRKYKCNSVGVQSSTVIRDFLSKNKNSNQYFYDFEDENEDFKLICDIFNFKRIELSRDNAEIIKEISEDLGIECVIDSIEKYFVELDKVSQAIDDQQKLIDRIDELFDFLYHIKEKTVETVSEFIYDSKWSKTEENVIELAAFILQVVNSNTLLHPYLIDLILKLNESDNNELKKLLPFVIKRVMLSFSKKINNQKCNSTELIYPFVYQLLKSGLINIKELSEKLKNFTNYKDTFFISWFLPEIMRFNPKMKDLLLKIDSDGKTVLYIDNVVVTLLYPCCPMEMEIENYLKLRDKGEYDNDIANALRKDDIDTFQSIITSSVENLLNKTIEPNIFEPFSIKKTNFLNYAAAYGSIKCFKYLILNDEKIDESTFDMAIIGGNNEIIRIVDNERIKQNQNQNQKGLRLLRNNIPKITYAIVEHKNDIFDWILEQNAEIKNGNNNLLPLVISSIENGNAHSLIQLIDNGFNFHNNLDKCPRLIETASERGFYLLVKLLLKLINKNSNQGISIDPKSTVEFGNISIFMLFDKNMKQDHLETSLLCAISSNNMKIVKYFFEVLINQNFKLDSKNSLKILEDSVQHKSNEIFDYLIDKIENLCPLDPKLLFKVIKKSYKAKNVESAIKNIEIINKKSVYYDFTAAFSHALKENLKEIIQYFIDKKYQVNYDNIAENISDIASIDIDIFELLMNNVDSSTQKVLKRYINKAIRDKNKPLIKYLLNKDSLLENSLIEAVRTNDLEIVDMILEKNSSPSYINQNLQSGTALYISVQSKRTEIFNRLIDIPGIDLNVYYIGVSLSS